MVSFKSLAEAIANLAPKPGYGQSYLSSPSQLLAHTLNTINNDVIRAPYNAFEKLAINTSGARLPMIPNPSITPFRPRPELSSPYQLQKPAQYYNPQQELLNNGQFFTDSPAGPNYLIPEFRAPRYQIGKYY